MAHVGQEFGLGAVGALGLRLLVEVALGEIGELVRLRLELLARLLEVENGGDQLLLGLDEAVLMALERRDVRAHRHVAAVLGAPLVDLQPASVLKAGLEGARAHILLLAAQELVLHLRRAAQRHHLRIGLALQLRVGRQLVQLLELRIAEHEVVVGIPQHEGLGDRLDGVVEPGVGLGGLLFQAALLGHVHGDADEMACRIVGIVHQLGAGAQPHPVARDAADAELVIDERGAGGSELLGQREEVLILGMDHGVHFAEGQELVLALVAEELVHGIGPVDPSAADVPIPQAAASAVQGGVDPVAHLLADLVGGTRAVRLHHIGHADAEQHQDRGAEQRDVADGARPPAGQDMRHGLHERDLPGRGGKRAHGRHALDAARGA